MKNKILTLILGIFLISFISANVIYSGETDKIFVDKEYVYYSIVGNSTIINLEIYQEGNYIYITPEKYSQDDNFTIIFFDREKETTTIYKSSGGGGARTIIKEKNVTEYIEVPKTEIEYIDKEVDKEIEVEKEFIPFWAFIVLGIFALIFVYFWQITKYDSWWNMRVYRKSREFHSNLKEEIGNE